MKIFIAGSNTRDVANWCQRYGLPKLYSFLNERTLSEDFDETKNLLMVDSGAHSWNKETITKIGMKRGSKLKPAREFIRLYYEWIQEQRHRKIILVEFDVYGHLSLQAINLLHERVMTLNPVAKFMRVYHPVIDGGSLEELKRWIDMGCDYIGVGNDSTDLLPRIFQLTRDRVKIHGFAMTKLDLMERFPFFSVDSTSPLSTVIFGRYSTPIMSFYERQDIFEMKSIEALDDDFVRIKKAVEECAVVQEYVTNLWTLKGITWNEIF